MKKLLLFLCASTVTGTLSAQHRTARPRTPDKTAFVRSLTSVVAARAQSAYPGDDFSEDKAARRILYGDIDGDGDEDAAVSYILASPGTRYVTELMVFRNQGKNFVYVTGFAFGEFINPDPHWKRDGSLEAIRNRKIVCAIKSWTEGDAHCCPSVKSHIKLVLDGKELKEIP